MRTIDNLKGQPILIYDIETTSIPGQGLNPNLCRMRFFGGYSYLLNKYFILSDKQMPLIQKIIDNHKFLVGFNNKFFDNVVLDNQGIQNIHYKYIIDLYKIIESRKSDMMFEGEYLHLLLKQSNLDEITRVLKLTDENYSKDKKFDYSILNKETFTEDELKYIARYLKKDLVLTKRLYEYLEQYFANFIDFLDFEDVKKKRYITSSMSVLAYKAICKAANLKEEYADHEMYNSQQYISGGYVGYPAGEYFENDIYCVDYNSMYPGNMIQANLYGRDRYELKENMNWSGGDIIHTHGKYNAKEMHVVGQVLQNFYEQRLEYKKINDSREYSIKRIINTCYGLLDNPVFKSVYDPVAAADCTRIGRQMIVYSREQFHKAGYKVLYTDTDSIFLQDPFKDKNRMLEVKDGIIQTLQKEFPFKWKYFDMGIDAEIKYMHFFKPTGKNNVQTEEIQMDKYDLENKKLGLMKKNYIYVAKVEPSEKYPDGLKTVIKNLGLVKRNTSELSKLIFKKYIDPELKKTGNLKYPKSQISEWIENELENNIGLVKIRYPVKAASAYKNPSQLQAQISEKYGPGVHFLIPNRVYGVGKGKKYCTYEEFLKYKISLKDIDLTKTWSELSYFEKKVEAKSIFSFVGSKPPETKKPSSKTYATDEELKQHTLDVLQKNVIKSKRSKKKSSDKNVKQKMRKKSQRIIQDPNPGVRAASFREIEW